MNLFDVVGFEIKCVLSSLKIVFFFSHKKEKKKKKFEIIGCIVPRLSKYSN